MADSLATVTDFAGWLGESLDPADRRAQAVLDAASALVRSEAGRAEWTAEDVPTAARTIVLQAAERKWRNPSGATSVSRSAGPFAQTFGYSGSASVDMYLTSRERAILSRFRPSTGLWVQPTERDPHLEVHRYVDVLPSGEPVLYYADEDFGQW